MKTFGRATLLACVLILCSLPASACSCQGGGFGAHEPCEHWSSYAVFVGKAVGVSVVEEGEYEGGWMHRVFLFDVLEGFVGVEDKKSVEVLTGMGGGDCGLNFEIGETYFVYTGGDASGNFWVGICSGMTKRLVRAEKDLAFAREVKRGGWTALYGRVRTNERDDLEDEPESEGLAGIEVRIEGPGGKRFEAVTDAQGDFTVDGQLEGTYTVRAVLPPGSPAAAPQTVELVKGECTGAEIVVSSLGTLRGRVVDDARKPVQELSVYLMPAGKPFDDESIVSDSTDEEGRYLFEEVPPGDYILVVNPDGPGVYDPPYPATYHPGVSDLAGAGRVKLEPSATLELRDLRLPPAIREVSVSGVVTWPDGLPAAGIWVVLAYTKWDGVPAETDADGRYELKGLEGLRYLLIADGEWTDAAFHSTPQEVVLDRGDLVINLVLEHSIGIETPGEWHRRGWKPLVPLNPPD